MESQWRDRQNEIAGKVKTSDDNSWHTSLNENGYHGDRPLFVAGTDISFSKTDNDESVATLTIMRLDGNERRELALSVSRRVKVENPYIAGFLGFREAPIVSEMLSVLEDRIRAKIDCILLDGNGILHHQKAGFACHVGVEHDIPAIGVSKSLLCVDGLNENDVREKVGSIGEKAKQEGWNVVGESGFCWGKALICGNATNKPIYVSVGHKVSLQSAVNLVKTLCTFRVPDPIRLADMHSRAYLRGEEVKIFHPHLFEIASGKQSS